MLFTKYFIKSPNYFFLVSKTFCNGFIEILLQDKFMENVWVTWNKLFFNLRIVITNNCSSLRALHFKKTLPEVLTNVNFKMNDSMIIKSYLLTGH
jgi:hypothetical protein